MRSYVLHRDMPLGYILYTEVDNYVKITNFKSYLVLSNTSKLLRIVLRGSMSDRMKNNGSFFRDIDFTNFKTKKTDFVVQFSLKIA